MPPISDFHASTIVRVQVSFVFSGFKCAPATISTALGLSPDRLLAEGEVRALRNGLEVKNLQSQWAIDSTSDSKDVNEHVRELLRRLLPAVGAIRPEWNPFFDVVWKGNYLYAGSGPFYERDVLSGVVELGAEVYQDIYQVDETASEDE